MNVSLLLLGGAKRVTLAEKLLSICHSFLQLDLYSMEKDSDFYPISSLAKIISGPSFSSPALKQALVDFISQYTNPIIIPCMDTAVSAVAALNGQSYGKTTIIGPTIEGAVVGLNKIATANFCEKTGVPYPTLFNSTKDIIGKAIAKPIEGYGSRDIHIYENPNQIDALIFNTHIVQQFIDGIETTHDLYITRGKSVIASSRERHFVTAGEVDDCLVRSPDEQEMAIFKKIAASNLFWGPLTVQTIKNDTGIFLIEINCRFGGGVTASIEAGVPLIENYIFEASGVNIPHREFKKLRMKRARRDFYQVIS